MARGLPSQTLSLSGSDWFIREDESGSGERDRLFLADVAAPGWIPARVPGNIQADLEAAHHLKPLWYGAGDPRLADVAKKDWWYRRDFDAPAAFGDRRLQLIFDGVDYACDVWLNGHHLGSHAGMFRRFAFDIADIIKPGQTNQLALRIERIPDQLAHILEASDGKMSGGGEYYPRAWGPDFFVNGINRTRQLLQDLKSPTNFGWDWGVNVYTLGIWQDVRLEATGPVRIDWVQAQTELSNDHRCAKVRVNLETEGLASLGVRADIRILGHGSSVSATVEATLGPGDNAVAAELTIDAPALWWPNGQGDQPLYTLEASLTDATSGEHLDARSTRFGVRDVRWEQVEGAPPDFINPYQLVINGRPARMLGSNIIPPDLLFGRMDERGPRLIRQAHAAGMNTLRIWGGGAFLTERMYDLADELGIMISQEFPMSSCTPETDEVFLNNLEFTVRQLVKRYRNHPCIIEWTGGNEMHWSEGDDHPALHLLKRVVAETDDSLFRATCPIQGARHSPWHYDPETHYAHYDDEDMTDTGMRREQHKMMRYGEFGCHSLAHVEVWQREIPPADRWPPDDLENPVLIRKNLAHAVFTEEHWLLKSILDALFGPIDTLEALIEAGQYLGAHGLRYAVDALRRRGRQIGGMTTWVFNEPWPNGGGPYLVDYDGRPLMIYDFLKQALAPIGLSLRFASNRFDPNEGLDAELWLVSDAPTAAADLRWRWLVRDRFGKVLAQNEGGAAIQPRDAFRLDAIKTGALDGDSAGLLLAELQLAEGDGETLVERAQLFGSAESATPLRGLLAGAEDEIALSRANLRAEIRSHQSKGATETLQIELINDSSMTALFCEPRPMLSYRTDIDIDNNHAFVPPGETRRINISAPVDSAVGLSLPQTGWRITCWNADDVYIPPSDDVILSIGRQDAMTREYARNEDNTQSADAPDVAIEGKRPNPAALPYLMTKDFTVSFGFDVADDRDRSARLRLHTADQDESLAPQLQVMFNGKRFESMLGKGLGIQKDDPDHLAFPQSCVISLPGGTLRGGRNTLELRLLNPSWFSWDAIDLIIGDK